MTSRQLLFLSIKEERLPTIQSNMDVTTDDGRQLDLKSSEASAGFVFPN